MLQKLSALATLTVIGLVEPLQAIAQQTSPTAPLPPQGSYWPGPWHMWSQGYGWHWWIGPPMMMLFFVIACAVVLLFARSARSASDRGRSAMQILNERFARGEIQKDEYEAKKAAILAR